MPRYAKANQTIDDLKTFVAKACDPDYDVPCIYGILNGSDSDTPAQAKVRADLSKINVDFENAEEFGTEDSYSHLPGLENLDGYEMIGSGPSAFPVLWCAGGGDWEFPLVFILYIGQKGELRAYIPENGNVYNKKEKAAYGNNDDDPSWDDDPDNPLLQFDEDKLRADVAGRIVVKGVVEEKKENTKSGILTFRQLIQSLRDFEDQHAAVCPVAEGAEDPVWGIAYIWFENGILNLGQYDDEGDSCGGIADEIENCVPADHLDEVAIIRIGVAEDMDKDADDDDKKELYDPYGRVSKSHNVKSSVVKACPDDWFCEWTLEFT